MSLFRIEASLFPTSSVTRELGDVVVSEWAATTDDPTVTRRDLVTDPIPFHHWTAAVGAGEPAARDEALEAARGLADELIAADSLLFTFPLYNYGVPQQVKSWFDLAYTDPRIDPTGTALRGKPAVLVTALGGNYDEGSPKHGWDHATPWMRRVLEDVWGLDLQVVRRSFTLVGVNPAMDRFAEHAAAAKAEAEADARRAGRHLAGVTARV